MGSQFRPGLNPRHEHEVCNLALDLAQAGVDALADDVCSPKPEAQVRDTAANFAPGADLLDGLARVDEVDAVRVVLLDACVDIPYVYVRIWCGASRASGADVVARARFVNKMLRSIRRLLSLIHI